MHKKLERFINILKNKYHSSIRKLERLKNLLKAKYITSIEWLKNHFEIWTTLSILIIFITFLILGPWLHKITIYPGEKDYNRLYLLSTIAQSLAAILALVITITLVSVQLASQTLTPRIVKWKLRDGFFWGMIFFYGFVIFYSILLMALMKNLCLRPAMEHCSIEICILLTGAALLFLVPYVFETINSLKPNVFVFRLLKKNDFEAVEDIFNKFVNEGLISVVEEIGSVLDKYTAKEMDKLKDLQKRRKAATQTAQCYRNAGKRAFHKSEIEIFPLIFRHLKELTQFCMKRVYRIEADIFNDTLSELYDFSQEKEEHNP